MRLDAFLSPGDAARAARVLRKLTTWGLAYAVTGGVALEAALGKAGRTRPLNGIALVVSDFAALPAALGEGGLLIRHVHPRSPPGEIVIQLVDPDQRLRVDVFSARGAALARAPCARLSGFPLRAIGLEDMASRLTSHLLSYARGGDASPEAAADWRRAMQAIDPATIDSVWRDQRTETDPESFAEAASLVATALDAGPGRLVEPDHAAPPGACPHCEDRPFFRLSDPGRVAAALGHV